MSKIILFIMLFFSITAFGPTIYNNYQVKTRMITKPDATNILLPKAPKLVSTIETVKVNKVKKTIQMEDSNIVVLRGPVTNSSVAKVQLELQNKAYKLNKTDPIYLVLDTPGGSVFAGLQLIDFVKSLDHKVHTITLFAASMGFQIAQNLDTRYIGTSATLMSHRARLGGLGGQLDGEFESRYKMIKRQVDYLDVIASKRMNMNVQDYKKLIFNEYWVHGYDSVSQNAADEEVNLTCGKSLSGTTQSTIRSMFGTFNVLLSKCPLIRGPLKIIYKGKHHNKVNTLYKDMYNNVKYVKDYIVTDKHYQIFGN